MAGITGAQRLDEGAGGHRLAHADGVHPECGSPVEAADERRRIAPQPHEQPAMQLPLRRIDGQPAKRTDDYQQVIAPPQQDHGGAIVLEKPDEFTVAGGDGCGICMPVDFVTL